jgi:glycosyltransferase involved in cell wall biosynthesis
MPTDDSLAADRPLRVLHLLLATESGGLSKYVLDLCAALSRRGHEMIVAGDRGSWHERFVGKSFEFIEIPLKRGFGGFRESRARMRALLRDRPIDLIHTHYRRATLLARRVQREFDVPILYTLHLSHISLRWPRRWFTDFGDHVHAASEDSRRWIVDEGRVDPAKITLVPHGVDVGRFAAADVATKTAARRSFGLDDSDLVAAFVGRLEDPKNESWLIDLAAATAGQFPKLRVLLAGDGPNAPRLRDRIDAENLHDRVRLLGEIDPLPLYQAADALLLPSAREGFSYVCAEAMSVGVPVLRTRTSGTTATIVENVTGRSTEIDHDAFIRAAVEFLGDRKKLVEMGKAAAAHVRAELTFDLQVNRTLDLYRRMARLPPPSPGTPGGGKGEG